MTVGKKIALSAADSRRRWLALPSHLSIGRGCREACVLIGMVPMRPIAASPWICSSRRAPGFGWRFFRT